MLQRIETIGHRKNLHFYSQRSFHATSMLIWDRCQHLMQEKKIPGFPINSSQVKILRDPEDFYETFVKKCKGAQKRIVLASLYLGTGAKESRIMTSISNRMLEVPALRVHVLLDCLRGSRGESNSRTMLLPLLKNHNFKVSLFQTPRYRGLLRLILPHRYNEVVGLQHMKLYLFDDDLIITGANLSNDYFCQRQDRYIMISACRSLGDYVENLTSTVSDFSFQLNENDQLSHKQNSNLHPTTTKFNELLEHVRKHVNKCKERFFENRPLNNNSNHDTVIYPLLEMGQFGIHQESQVTKRIIEESPVDARVRLSTGYFNITKDLADSIINRSKAVINLLMAHPKANGFYNAQGPAGGIPKGYSELAGRFYDEVQSHNQESRVQLYEYERDGWTFHSKGLWLMPHPSSPPVLTLIGSPNFGERSYHHDIECQFLLMTKDAGLQQALQEESEWLFKHGSLYTQHQRQRKPPLWVKIVLYLFKTYL